MPLMQLSPARKGLIGKWHGDWCVFVSIHIFSSLSLFVPSQSFSLRASGCFYSTF